MADTYLMESLEADPQAIRENSIGRLRQLLSGYDPDRDPYGSLLLQAVVEAQVPLVEVASDVLATIFAHVAEVAGTERIMPRPAAGLVTLTTDGAETRVLPAGATLRGVLPDGTAVVFAVTADTTIEKAEVPVPGVPVETSGVPVEAVRDELRDDITRPQVLVPDQAYTWLHDVTLTDLTHPGADGEDDDAYMDRATSAMRDQADMLILPDNVQRFVQRMPGVGRALVLDRVDATNPHAPLRPVDRCVTVVVAGTDGGEPSGLLLAEIRDRLHARREVCFKFSVVPATYKPLEIELTVAAWPDAAGPAGSSGTVDRVREALRAWLHPLAFGTRPGAFGEAGWEPVSTVRVGEVVSVVDRVAGVDYVDPKLVFIGGANADYAMSALLAALPDPENLEILVHVEEREP